MNTNEHNSLDSLITRLYNWCTTFKNQPLLKDTSKLRNTMFDAYVDSDITNPLSFTVFELSDKGELLINKQQRVLESQAAFFLFVNPKTGWIFALKNTLENKKKLLTNQPIQNFKIKIVE